MTVNPPVNTNDENAKPESRSRILRTCIFLLVIVLAITAIAWRQDNGAKEGVKGPQNVILIGWDGCNVETLFSLLEQDKLPNLKKLYSEGAITRLAVHSGATNTKAGWAQILTGYHPYKTGVFSNFLFRSMPKNYTIHERLKNHFGDDIETIFIAGKILHIDYPYANIGDKIDFFRIGVGKSPDVGEAALKALDESRGKRFFAFIHFGEPDEQGHKFGQNSTEYELGIIEDDRWLGEIVGKLHELGVYEKTTVYVVTDHGFNDYGFEFRSHGDSPYIFLATNDGRIESERRTGLDPLKYRGREDIAPTVLEKFGLSADEFNPRLDGMPLTVPLEAVQSRSYGIHPYSRLLSNKNEMTPEKIFDSECSIFEGQYTQLSNCTTNVAVRTGCAELCMRLNESDQASCIASMFNVEAGDVNLPTYGTEFTRSKTRFLNTFSRKCMKFVRLNKEKKAADCVTRIANETGLSILCYTLEGRRRGYCLENTKPLETDSTFIALK